MYRFQRPACRAKSARRPPNKVIRHQGHELQNGRIRKSARAIGSDFNYSINLVKDPKNDGIEKGQPKCQLKNPPELTPGQISLPQGS